MVYVGVGMSVRTNTQEATLEALRAAMHQSGQTEVGWCVVFFSAPHLPFANSIRTIIHEQTGCSCIAGCSAAGVLSNYGEVMGGPGICIMIASPSEISVKAFVKEQTHPSEASISQQLKETIETFSRTSPLVLFFPDAFQHHPYNFLNMFNYTRNKPFVFGAGASDDGLSQTSVEIGPEGVMKNAASGLCLGNVSNFSMGLTQSCTPVGDPLFITKTDSNTLLTLDTFSALEVYTTLASQLGLESIESASEQLLISFPLDRENPEFTGETSLIRNIGGIDVASQGLIIPHPVEVGSPISFVLRSAAAAEQDMWQMLQRLKAKNAQTPTLGFYFNCASRGEALYGYRNVDTQAIKEELGDFPLIGFFGGYEMASVSQGVQLYSNSGVLVLIYQ
ncbi:FIST N-terminal domain-containing protein [Deltaproteobacteria bacterium TL4]